ncbi:MAG: PqqD family protein [Gemmatimonadales bacterium]
MTERYVRHADLRLADVEGDGVVLHLGTRRYFSVSESGLVLLQALEAPQSVQDLVQLLTDRYDVTAKQADSSVRQFLDSCRNAELLVVEDGR